MDKKTWKRLLRKGIFSKITLGLIALSTLLFVDKMINLFELYQSTPDELIRCYFAFIGVEAGVLGKLKWEERKAGKCDETSV